jgi:ribosomal protein S18 acetylase RimI-like enzyme
VIQYRHFRNNDPPGLVEIWNQAFPSRGAVHLRHSNPLERHVFAKPYFDPAGLIVAREDDTFVGFAHAGFGPNAAENGISRETGILSMIAVKPTHRRRGIGSELLRRAEGYLTQAGARVIHAGGLRPYNPFYLGLYGGSELPGVLASDTEAGPFLEHRGYQPTETTLVFQRRLDELVNIPDGRFATLRRRYEMRILPRVVVGTWWQECTLGLIEPVEFRLEERLTNKPVARATAWDMEGFSWRWNQPTVGLTDLLVMEGLRRQGLGKFLMAQILRYLQEQFFGLVEVQTLDCNDAAVRLFRSVGFQQVDVGRGYRKVIAAPTTE